MAVAKKPAKAVKSAKSAAARPSRAKPDSVRSKARAATAHLPPSERPRQSRAERGYKKLARLMYVEESATIEKVAAFFKVSAKTIGNWKMRDKERGQDWDQMRTAYILGPGGTDSIVHEFVPRFFRLMRQTITDIEDDKTQLTIADKVKFTTSLTDCMSKATSAVGKLMPQLNEMTIALRVITHLQKFIGKSFPQHNQVFAEILEPFGDYVLEHFGKDGG
jgi:DNA polymerase I-like protein with 3'-5' exonuclease and polymerase domains